MVSLEVPFAGVRRMPQAALFFGESGSHGGVIETSAVPLPSIGMEAGDWSQHRARLGPAFALLVQYASDAD